MSKILYLCHIDWNWIKQRPQFIAEKLVDKHEVICIFPHWYNRSKLQNRADKEESKIKFIEFYGLPKAKKNIIIRKVNNYLRSLLTKKVVEKSKPDVIYICHPELYSTWMTKCSEKLVYDCMDDHYALVNNEKVKKLILSKENTLVKKSKIVLASSANLKNMLVQRYKCPPDKIHIVRNGFNGEILENKYQKERKSIIKIGYIGTVSSWFDFEILEDSLNIIEGLEYHIIGPVQSEAKKNSNNRIVFEGVVEHDNLQEKIADYDALIMPFVVNDIVKSVDPVKLYEYLNFSKPIISVYYEEIDRFDEFVWFYRTLEELIDAIFNVRAGKLKYSNEARRKFLLDSTWESRAVEIEKILEVKQR